MSRPTGAIVEEGTARSRRLIKGIGSSVVARAATSLLPLLLIPLTIRYLGTEQYGIWMAITSVTSMLLWADLGLGNGLLTKLAPLVAKGSWADGRAVVSAAYGLLIGVAVLGLFLVTASYWLVPWAGLLNASKDTSASGIAVICLGALALNIPAALVHRVLFAMQLVPSSNTVLLLGAVAALLFALAGVQSEVEPLLLIGGIVACPVIVNVLATVSLFARHPRLRPSIVMGREVAVSLLRTGGMFFVIGVLSPIALNADILIVAHIDSVSAVSEYSVVSRTFGAMGLLVTVINLPLWPANAEALARGDLGWVVRTTRRMVALSGIATMSFGVALLLVSGPLFQLLGGASIDHQQCWSWDSRRCGSAWA